MTTITDDIQRLRALLKKVGPEQWEALTDSHAPNNGKRIAWVETVSKGFGIADVPNHSSSRDVAALIAESRNLLPGILTELESALGENESLTKALDAASVLDEKVHAEANGILRKALGPEWNAHWGQPLEELGRVVDAVCARAQKAEVALEQAQRERDGALNLAESVNAINNRMAAKLADYEQALRRCSSVRYHVQQYDRESGSSDLDDCGRCPPCGASAVLAKWEGK